MFGEITATSDLPVSWTIMVRYFDGQPNFPKRLKQITFALKIILIEVTGHF